MRALFRHRELKLWWPTFRNQQGEIIWIGAGYHSRKRAQWFVDLAGGTGLIHPGETASLERKTFSEMARMPQSRRF